MKTNGKYLGQAIEITAEEYKPKVIFVSGGVHNFNGYFESAQKYIKDSSVLANNNVKVHFCDHDFSGCIGIIQYAEKVTLREFMRIDKEK